MFLLLFLQVGVDAVASPCAPCGTGSHSSSPGSIECTRCLENRYQDKYGQTSCKQCPEGLYSSFGQDKCNEPPACSEMDFSIHHDPIESCTKNSSGLYVRKQRMVLQGLLWDIAQLLKHIEEHSHFYFFFVISMSIIKKMI